MRTEQRADGTWKEGFEIGMGECLGEMSFLAEEPLHRLSVVCVRDTELVKISRPAFELLQARYPQVVARFSKVLCGYSWHCLSCSVCVCVWCGMCGRKGCGMRVCVV